jgi:hypothetical protein
MLITLSLLNARQCVVPLGCIPLCLPIYLSSSVHRIKVALVYGVSWT